MKAAIVMSALSAVAQAAYSGDIVQYWVDQSSILTNSSTVGGLPSPISAWFPAIVHGAVYSAALSASGETHAFQQLAVSYAAHDSLAWTFHGVRLGANIDNALRTVIAEIGIDQSSEEFSKAADIGQKSAEAVTSKRADDGVNHFVDYVHGPEDPGVYQATPGGRPLPDTPQGVGIRPFGGIANIEEYRAPAPPEATVKGYDKWVTEVYDLGGLNSTGRTEDETEIAYFWLESSVAGWNRFAHAIVGSSLADDVVASARFYAQLNYALANAAIGAWDSKFHWEHWRPVTAFHREGIWLDSGRDVYDPDCHQDYVSTHAAFGGAGAAVLKNFNGGDKIEASFSSNVTLDDQGVLTRHFTSIDQAKDENARSRIFGGIHFTYAGDAGNEQGEAIAERTLELFDEHWDDF